MGDGISAPSASEASLGLSAGRSNSLGYEIFSGLGPDNFDGNVADLDRTERRATAPLTFQPRGTSAHRQPQAE